MGSNLVAARTYKEAVASSTWWEVPGDAVLRLMEAMAGRRDVFPILAFVIDRFSSADAELEIRREDLPAFLKEVESVGADPALAKEAVAALARLGEIARHAEGAGLSLFGYTDIVVHENPAWRERANFVITAWIGETSRDTPSRWRWEQLWARKVGADRFEVCCIPFFLFDLALGDEVETGSRNGHDLVFRRVARPSGHSTFRVWFRDPAIRGELAGEIRDLGCATEWRSLTSNLLAVDAATRELAQKVADVLAAREKAGGIMYETGRTG